MTLRDRFVEEMKKPFDQVKGDAWEPSFPDAQAQELWNTAETMVKSQGFDLRVGDMKTMLNFWGFGWMTTPTMRGATYHPGKAVLIKRENSLNTRAYTLLHELGHVFHGEVKPSPEEAFLFKMGLLSRSNVRAVRESEYQAEMFVTLVLDHFGIEPNWEYFRSWKMPVSEWDRLLPVVEGRVKNFLDSLARSGVELTSEKEVAA